MFVYIQPLVLLIKMECYIHVHSSKEVGSQDFSFITAIRDSFTTENEKKFRFLLTPFLAGSSEQRESKVSKIKIF